jgi:hypothetical protein
MMTVENFSGSSYRSQEHTTNNARIAQLVERVFGKDEVPGSIPGVGSGCYHLNVGDPWWRAKLGNRFAPVESLVRTGLSSFFMQK